jgi:ABC-2 type transport system ATP-binding protein
MWREVRRLAEGGLTLLLTTHYLEEADQLAQRLAIVDRGRVVAEGTPDELKGGLPGDQVSLDDVYLHVTGHAYRPEGEPVRS